jgi:hypothetical protein
MVSMPQLVCCNQVSAGRCQELLLPVYQIGSPVFQLLIVYVLFLVFHPSRSRSADEHHVKAIVQDSIEILHEAQPSPPTTRFARLWDWLNRHEFALSLLGFITYILVALIVFSAIGLYIDLVDGDNSSQAIFYARVMAFLAVALNIAQWAPQIWVTARNRHVGSLSIIMLALQTPGGLLIVFYNAFIDPSDWSTWLPFIFSASMQFILLVMCIAFTYRDWKKRKAVEGVTETAPLLPNRG